MKNKLVKILEPAYVAEAAGATSNPPDPDWIDWEEKTPVRYTGPKTQAVFMFAREVLGLRLRTALAFAKGEIEVDIRRIDLVQLDELLQLQEEGE